MRSSLRSAPRRLHFAPIALVTGVAAAALLSASMTGTLSGFVASITNSTNTAASGALVMQEQNSDATVTCLSSDNTLSTNTASCSTINKFGGNLLMVPGQTVTTAITIKNAGTVPAATFKLTPGATCTQSTNGTLNGSATDLCAKLNVVITSGATTVFSGTLATLAGAAQSAFTMPAAPIAGATIPFSFAVTLDSGATNSYQGLAASLPLTWSFSS
jgi:hypothetical protein